VSKLDDLRARYLALSHAIQTGVAYELPKDGRSATPKHLRTGLDIAMVEHGALVRLLIKKGLITEEEYFEEVIAGLEDEKRQYEERLQQLYGGKTKITLG
jgi:hypothetical protein